MRFNVPLDMEFVPLSKEAKYYNAETKDFSRDGLSFASNGNIDNVLNGLIMLKFKLLQDSTYIYALGDIRWKKQVSDKYLVGVKIRRLDLETRNMKLDFPFNIWKDNFDI